VALGDTTAFVRSVRRHTHIAATHPSFTDADILVDGTEELHSYLLPLGMGERQELWAGPVGRLSFTVTEGKATYAIPSRAVGGKLRAVRLLDRQGTPSYLSWYGREEVAQWVESPGMPFALVVEGSTFRLFPVPRGMAGYTLEVDVYLRPAELVPVAQTAVIETVGSVAGNTTVTITTTADSMALSTAPTVDVVSSGAPFDFQAVDAAVVDAEDLGGGQWTLTLSGALDVSVGAYLCLPGQAPVVQAPL